MKTKRKKIYIELQSFCTQNYRKGKSEFLGEIFQLNQLAIEQNIVLDNGRIPNGLYRNIVIIGTAVKEFEWTENFINEYKVYLEDDKKGDVVTLCEASLEFSKGNFETTLTKLALVKYQDILYALHVRNLQLQCYYEMDNYEESFYNSTNALSAFLSRNQVLGPMVKEASLNFLKYIKKLQTQKVGLKQNVEGYIADLEQAHNVSNKKWLLEKAQELV